MLIPLKTIDDDDTPGQQVQITGGLLAGRSGSVEALSDEPMPRALLIALDRDGGNVWIDVQHLSIKVEPNTTIYAERSSILKFLENCAESDMRKARKHGEILIAQTLRGLVALAYEKITGTYTLTTQDGGSWQVSGRRKITKPEIINLYSIIEKEETRATALAA